MYFSVFTAAKILNFLTLFYNFRILARIKRYNVAIFYFEFHVSEPLRSHHFYV